MYFTAQEVFENLRNDLALYADDDLGFNIRKELDDNSESMIKELKKFKISAFAWAVDPNASLIIHDLQNPEFIVKFRSPHGVIKTRKIQARIHAWGFKIEFAIRLDLIFFVDTTLDFENMSRTIHLDRGIDVTLQPIAITVCGFREHAGALLMLSIPIGISGGLMMVTGGTLTPVDWDHVKEL
jgi:hypothetical protein